MKEEIKKEFYKNRLEQEFREIWKGLIMNGSVLKRELIIDRAVLSDEYKSILIELLEETGYFKEQDLAINGPKFGSSGDSSPSTK